MGIKGRKRGGEKNTYVMIVLLHCNHPRHVVKGDGPKTKVCIVWNLFDFAHKAVQVMSLNAIDGGDKIRRR